MESYDLFTSFIGKVSSEAHRESIVASSSVPQLAQSGGGNDNVPSLRTSTAADRLVGILTDNGAALSATRKPICIEPKVPRRQEISAANILHVQLPRAAITSASGGKCGGSTTGKQKIPRPANAFMLFANEWRKKLAVENPRESNKDISVRLGVLWKNMAKDIKEKYFALAREVDAEHKRKYPDYVYNPKEARLRKAMREQSRELSRQSILQTAIASATGSASVTGNGGNGGGVSASGNFLGHPMACTSPAASVSSLPGSPAMNPNRINNPWFPVGHPAPASHLKPILSSRVMAAHQRTLDKTKEAIRKQVECAAAGAFSAGGGSGYAGDFGGHGPPGGVSSAGPGTGQVGNEYCIIAEFAEGQKWHPYQNGANAYHARGASMPKVGGLHPNVQSGNPHGHGPWAQFCGLPLPSPAAQSSVIRAPRHMVFLQDQQDQHCAFPEDMQMPYVPGKAEASHRLHVAYPQVAEHQSKNTVSPLHMPQLQDDEKCMESGPRWDQVASASEPDIGNLSAASRRDAELLREQEQGHEQPQELQQSAGKDEPKQKTGCKQPLPGFHQAFGSTEIGRFSRSEFFANMVGCSDGSCNVSSNRNGSCNGNGGNRPTLTENSNQSNAVNAGANSVNFNNLALTAYYNEVRSPTPATPRWHNSYVSVIGSEI